MFDGLGTSLLMLVAKTFASSAELIGSFGSYVREWPAQRERERESVCV
jgi:hypothetical protein